MVPWEARRRRLSRSRLPVTTRDHKETQLQPRRHCAAQLSLSGQRRIPTRRGILHSPPRAPIRAFRGEGLPPGSEPQAGPRRPGIPTPRARPRCCAVALVQSGPKAARCGRSKAGSPLWCSDFAWLCGALSSCRLRLGDAAWRLGLGLGGSREPRGVRCALCATTAARTESLRSEQRAGQLPGEEKAPVTGRGALPRAGGGSAREGHPLSGLCSAAPMPAVACTRVRVIQSYSREQQQWRPALHHAPVVRRRSQHLKGTGWRGRGASTSL